LYSISLLSQTYIGDTLIHNRASSILTFAQAQKLSIITSSSSTQNSFIIVKVLFAILFGSEILSYQTITALLLSLITQVDLSFQAQAQSTHSIFLSQYKLSS